jgi:hypothetical protein
MGLRLEDKQAMVTEVQAVAQTAHSVVAAEYRGLTVSQLTGLRAKARQAGVYMRVVKNTLARRAVAGTPYECIAGNLKGPLILAFSKEDPGAAARTLGVREGKRQAGPDAGFSGRAGLCRLRDRPRCEPADEGASPLDTARRAEGAGHEVRAHAGRARRNAGAHGRRDQGHEGRLTG